jgi:acyl-CoA synthetase (AMP-forming)/AMP-acid ligase II
MWLHADIQAIPDIVRHYARISPDNTALTQGGRIATFGMLDVATSRLANAILARKPPSEAVIAFIGKNSIPFFEVLFGATKAGCAILPLNWRLAAAELAAIVDDACPTIVFVDKEFAGLMGAAEATCAVTFETVLFDSSAEAASGLEAWSADSPLTDPAVAIKPMDVALLMYTSGTTGVPKGVEITHQGLNYMRLCEHFEPELQWRSDDVLLMVMPNFHLLGTGIPLQSLYNGSRVSILPVIEPGRLLERIQADRPTIIVIAPTVIQMMLDHPAACDTDFSSLRIVMYAGSPINAQLLRRALLEMKCEFIQFYGATESSGAMTILRPAQHDLVDEQKLRSCGTPLPLIEFRVTSASGEELPDGEIGEFQVRSPTLFRGYRNQPAATAAALSRGWYRTGDAGYRDAKDGLLYIVDRVKDMIVSGGENIYSAEVEQALQKHPAVSMSAVVGAPDARWGEKVVAFIVLKKDAVATTEDLIAHSRGLIAGFKVPKDVRFVETLPISPAGKILKRVLREEIWKGQERAIA